MDGVAVAIIAMLRVASLLVFWAPMLLTRRGDVARPRVRHTIVERLPVIANFASIAAFFPLLVAFSGELEGQRALIFATAGCVFALLGAAVLLWSRQALGTAWSLTPAADEATGLVTTGPYRFVRHPIYLGFLMLTAGEAIAFNSEAVFVILLAAVVPTFLWRAYAEERILERIFGDRYAAYRKRTRLIVPFVL